MNKVLIRNLMFMKEFLLPEVAVQIVLWQIQTQNVSIKYNDNRITLIIDYKCFDWFNKKWCLLNLLSTNKKYYIIDSAFYKSHRLILMNNGDAFIFAGDHHIRYKDHLCSHIKIKENINKIQVNISNFCLISGRQVETFSFMLNGRNQIELTRNYYNNCQDNVEYHFIATNAITNSKFTNLLTELDIVSYCVNPILLITPEYDVFQYNLGLIDLGYKAKHHINKDYYFDIEDYLCYNKKRVCQISGVNYKLCSKIRSCVVIISKFITVIDNDFEHFTYNIRARDVSYEEDAFVVIDFQHRVYNFRRNFLNIKNWQPEIHF